MKIALLSDIHGNKQAFEACLLHAQKQDVTQYAFIGDYVGYGADPVFVLDKIMEMKEMGAWVVSGNHEQMALVPPEEVTMTGQRSAAWTHSQLSEKHFNFIQALPMSMSIQDILLVHASADQPDRWRYVDSEQSAMNCLQSALKDSPNCRHIFVGHVHHQRLFYQGAGRGLMQFDPKPGVPIPVPTHRQWVATIGSVGQPRDLDPRAMYAVYDQENNQLIFHRVEYDITSAAAAIRNAGLPEHFAERIEVGK